MLNYNTLPPLPNALYPAGTLTPAGNLTNGTQGGTIVQHGLQSGLSYPAQFATSLQTVQSSQPSPNIGQASPQAGQIQSIDPKTLKMGSSFGAGTLYGGLFGGLVGLPLFALERGFKHNSMTEILKLYQAQLGSTPKLEQCIKKLSSPMGHCASSVLTVGILGMCAGSVLGPWMAHRINNRLKEINDAKQQQSQGLWQPKPPNLMQKLGLADKPVENPDQDYQDLLNNYLNPDKAFTQGAVDVFKLKVLKGALPLGVMMGVGVYSKKNPAFFGEAIAQQMAGLLRQCSQPIFWAKLAALPVVGGLIAQKIVPQMREKLNIQNPNEL